MTTHMLLNQNFNWEIDTPSLLTSLRILFTDTAQDGADITQACTDVAVKDSIGQWADVSDVTFQCTDPDADNGDLLEIDRCDYMIFDVQRLSGNWISASMIALDTLMQDTDDDPAHDREYSGMEHEFL